MQTTSRALLSVYDKRGLAELAQGLHGLGIELLSTGGTFKVLEKAGVPVVPVSEVTQFPEILDGRVKTLHPRIHGGILADRGRGSHLGELREHSILPIDLVVVNLYPFRQTAAAEGATFEQVVEMIDIGGPAMVRAAAKNHQGVVVVVDPNDYPQVLAALEEGERVVPEGLRRRLAIKAFRHTQAYDAAIASWLESQSGDNGDFYPRHLLVDLQKEFEPRYGENPHQRAALYSTQGEGGVFGGFEQLQGKELSYNNLLDADAARKLVGQFEEPAVAIVKHNNPCGVGRGSKVVTAYERALACDPVSAFGSIVALNRPADGELAEAMASLFVEVVIAPGFDKAAVQNFAAKTNLRVLECPVYEAAASDVDLRAIQGGFVAQTLDTQDDDPTAWTCPTKRVPSDAEQEALEMAWKVVRHVKSNAIVITNRMQTVGIGAGQMSRVDSCRLAIAKAQIDTTGCVAASDAFFPFADGLETLADAGVTAIVQPGGSKRDEEVVAAANRRKVAMLFTGTRHFRH
ncbi:MAG: bifunctional phosphoribosylaminoimidazolecarboxamide formyltransferase/IMP cyclohydrolase [Acidobacteria bacterium]|nr:MAG: bifunctional phosphoribosylaminoimidazolecarboxamide formyltransferase/IMP cyclohydrolase [Acidobacteriota bacterium]